MTFASGVLNTKLIGGGISDRNNVPREHLTVCYAVFSRSVGFFVSSRTSEPRERSAVEWISAAAWLAVVCAPLVFWFASVVLTIVGLSLVDSVEAGITFDHRCV